MVKVATARDGFEARILAARLGSDGIVWELRGNVGGPYPVGAVDVLVAPGDEEVARALLAVDASDGGEGLDGADDFDDLGAGAGAGSGGADVGGRSALAAGIVLVLVALTGLARILALL